MTLKKKNFGHFPNFKGGEGGLTEVGNFPNYFFFYFLTPSITIKQQVLKMFYKVCLALNRRSSMQCQIVWSGSLQLKSLTVVLLVSIITILLRLSNLIASSSTPCLFIKPIYLKLLQFLQWIIYQRGCLFTNNYDVKNVNLWNVILVKIAAQQSLFALGVFL